ncbi:glycosyltransferase family 2 protein [Capnocytophaga sp. G2]|jgi:Predicted glycosyltransferases|uniref:glycosyltransferase family 2 protein n=1 Tax=Capnocytophaga sp. G2 TaxID=3110695 RepID=UPI002B48DA63|nr:glycosyltransferase family 2 protein [Capnocytophaga sp. G2]MEB3004380.1 glycosyltransferase family 2 protein [Capnocytophaga sp. G2]
MNIAVVILNWNGMHLLEQFLPSVVTYSKEADLYVIDNASTDESIAFLQKYYPQVRIIQNTHNYGYAKGYNEGLKHISADIYCLLNSDVQVTPHWLEAPMTIFGQQSQISILQPKIKSYRQKNLFEYAGAAGGYIDKYGYPYCRGRIFDAIEEDKGQYEDNKEIFWASGACFFIRKSVFDILQGFDEDFFAHQEEIDLCWRAQNKGYKVYYTSQSQVYHLGGATLNEGSPKKIYLNFRNSLFMLLKNLPKGKWFSVIFLRMILDGIAGIRFFLQGKISNTWAIIRAHVSFYRYFCHFYHKRENPSLENYYSISSVVYQHFIKHNI